MEKCGWCMMMIDIEEFSVKLTLILKRSFHGHLVRYRIRLYFSTLCHNVIWFHEIFSNENRFVFFQEAITQRKINLLSPKHFRENTCAKVNTFWWIIFPYCAQFSQCVIDPTLAVKSLLLSKGMWNLSSPSVKTTEKSLVIQLPKLCVWYWFHAFFPL